MNAQDRPPNAFSQNRSTVSWREELISAILIKHPPSYKHLSFEEIWYLHYT